jgi:hypothetical protein
MSAADAPAVETGMEGGIHLTDNAVRMLHETAPTGPAWQQVAHPQGLNVPSGFPPADVAPTHIDFSPAPGLENGGLSAGLDGLGLDNVGVAGKGMLPGLENCLQNLGPIGEQIGSLIQSALAMPGPGAILTALFQFFVALFQAVIPAFDPMLIAQQAQGALDLKKMMLASQGL